MTDTERLQDDLTIARLALGVSRRIDLDATARQFVGATLEYTGATAGLLYLYDGENDTFHLQASHLAVNDPRRRGIMTLDLAEMRGEGPPATWGPSIAEPPAGLRAIGLERVLAVPLPGAGALIGMLMIGPVRQPPPGVDEMDRLGRLIPELLPALVNACLVERYRSLVIKDDQTDCFNRRHFDRVLSEEVYRAHRYGTALALIFLDLDNLKEINAAHGHATGSRMVREVARRLVGTVRGSDRVFRYGGDEFCVILPGTGLQGARELAERLRVNLECRPVPIGTAENLRITASFGIASYPGHARTGMGLVKRADEAMQAAKRIGKNSIAIAGEAVPSPSAATGGVA
jgi:diguanylate cyclase (GGDEF)-like protein